MMCCASCGIAAVDDIKLKDCDDGCDLVKYCSDHCQENHREQHKEGCKKRKAELRDRDLFTMPNESHLGECPICCLPQSLDDTKSSTMPCCSRLICDGCNLANARREMAEGLKQRCAFCREPMAKLEEECIKNCMKRVKKNDPAAMTMMGQRKEDEGDYETALKYLAKAAELGDAEAHYSLSVLYRKGEGVEKSKEKAVYHWEEAAIAGHPNARYNLGIEEWNNGRFERARKHFIIAANLGLHDSLKCLKELYANGHASKEEYLGALRGYQAALDATKSEEREKAEKAMKSGKISFAF
jgi:tetratricopeptide (TPR) repeat protein